MTAKTVEQALEDIYASVNADNENIDVAIDVLRASLATRNTRAVTVDPARLTHNNRQGRKMMQAYFRKRGVDVSFSA